MQETCQRLFRERKISPKFFRPKFFHGRPRGMSVPKCLFFFQDLEGLTEVFGGMSAGMSGPKLPLWAEFLFLTIVAITSWGMLRCPRARKPCEVQIVN